MISRNNIYIKHQSKILQMGFKLQEQHHMVRVADMSIHHYWTFPQIKKAEKKMVLLNWLKSSFNCLSELINNASIWTKLWIHLMFRRDESMTSQTCSKVSTLSKDTKRITWDGLAQPQTKSKEKDNLTW